MQVDPIISQVYCLPPNPYYFDHFFLQTTKFSNNFWLEIVRQSMLYCANQHPMIYSSPPLLLLQCYGCFTCCADCFHSISIHFSSSLLKQHVRLSKRPSCSGIILMVWLQMISAENLWESSCHCGVGCYVWAIKYCTTLLEMGLSVRK